MGMARTKRSMVDGLIRRHVLDAVGSILLDGDSDADALRRQSQKLAARISWRLVQEDYNWLELSDIMGWKKRKFHND